MLSATSGKTAHNRAETHRQGQQLYKDSGIPVRLGTRNASYALDVMREYLAASLDKTSRHAKLFVFSTLQRFKSQVETYVWDSFAKGSQKGQSKDTPRKKNDHLINAAQYLLATTPRGRSHRAPDYNKDASYT